MSDPYTKLIVDKKKGNKMNKIQIRFANGEVLVTTENNLNGYILKGIRTQNEVVECALI